MSTLTTGVMLTCLLAAQNGPDNGLEIRIDITSLSIKASFDTLPDFIEIRFYSDRNRIISSISDISCRHPDPESRRARLESYIGNIWYPVVDILPETGMEGMLTGSGSRKGRGTDTGYVIVNGPFYRDRQPVRDSLLIPAHKLYAWENSIFTSTKDWKPDDFYLRQRFPVYSRSFSHTFTLLSEKWTGSVALYVPVNGILSRISASSVQAMAQSRPAFPRGESLDYGRLLGALKGTLEYLENSQIRDPGHPSSGGLFMFYDHDADMYRTYHWVWWWGPAISLMLQSAELFPEEFDPAHIHRIVREIGKRSLDFRYHDPGFVLDGAMISSWKQNNRFHNGYAGSIIIADALFMAGWGWIPLYRLTGDSTYLRASLRQCEITRRLLEDMELIPHSYHIEDREWYPWYLNEFGFGVEGYGGLYRALGDERFREEGRSYIDRYRKYFEMDDGFWYREYDMEARQPVRPGYATVRGMAWAFEGLVAAEELMPGEGYLEKAEKMADIVLRDQQEDGSWPHSFGKDPDISGFSEKGTAIWSYMLYRLYYLSKKQKYLDAARSALVWCMNRQYDGELPGGFGGIPAATPNSGITYRAWFNMSCSYTSVFFGLALIEELKLSMDQ